MIKWFKEVSKQDFNLVGGKGYNLSLMYNAGINVPNGFIITSQSYDQYISENNLAKKIEDVLDSHKTLDEKSKIIMSIFDVEKVSDSLKDTILKQINDVSKTYAVRSSSTVEDLPGLSFAGQYSSFLNVKKEDIIKKVVECWQSLWLERAIDYRKKNLVTSRFTHCVVVQEMVNAAVSGVMFTSNPVNGIRNEIFINASYGLGEAIVSGMVNPDQYIIDKSTKKTIQIEVMKKEIQCVYSGTGIETIDIPSDLINTRSLDDGQLLKLVEAANIVVDYFGEPQDIEFSFDDIGNFFILQSRDITTLYPIEELDKYGKLRVYMTASTVLLGMKEAFTPLGANLYGGMFPKVISVMTNRKKPLSDDFVKYEGGRILIDISYLMSSKFVSKQFGKAFSGNDLPLKAVFEKVIKEHGYTLTHQGIKFKIPWGALKYVLSFISKMKITKKVSKDKKYQALKDMGQLFYEDRLSKSKMLKILDEKWEFCEETMLEVFKLTQLQALYCVEVGSYGKLEKSIKKMFGDSFNLDVLGYALPECNTVEMGLELNNIAKYLVENNEELSKDHPKVIEFLSVYGVRANVELDVGYERWRENPEFIMDQIRNFITDKQYEKNLEDHRNKQIEAEEMIEAIGDAIACKKSEKAGQKMKDTLRVYRTAAGMREYPKFNIVQVIDLMRRVLIEEGKKQVNLGNLNNANDIFFIRKHELNNINQWKLVVEKRKATYEKEMKRNSIPRIVFNTGETIYSAQKFDKNAKVLQGFSLSSGVYEGKIRIVHNPLDNELKDGEIMVAESTNPAWTPLFMRASGLITEYGGPLSHGGIVAREYGIPAVVGISSVTKLLKDGQNVRINGDTGTIELLD